MLSFYGAENRRDFSKKTIWHSSILIELYSSTLLELFRSWPFFSCNDYTLWNWKILLACGIEESSIVCEHFKWRFCFRSDNWIPFRKYFANFSLENQIKCRILDVIDVWIATRWGKLPSKFSVWYKNLISWQWLYSLQIKSNWMGISLLIWYEKKLLALRSHSHPRQKLSISISCFFTSDPRKSFFKSWNSYT